MCYATQMIRNWLSNQQINIKLKAVSDLYLQIKVNSNPAQKASTQCMHTEKHTRKDGQPKNIMPQAPSIA